MRHAARNALLLWAAACQPTSALRVAGAATGLGGGEGWGLGADGAAEASAPPPGCWEPKLELDLSPPAQGLPPHPRLRLNDSALQRLNATIRADPMAQRLFQSMHDRGVAMLDEPPANCSKGADMLAASRAVLVEVYTLGLLFRLTHDERFGRRASAELLHVTTSCSTWDPFGLALAEMTHAVGIGYDWLYHFLSHQERATIVAGVTALGFDEALEDYANGEFWTNCTFVSTQQPAPRRPPPPTPRPPDAYRRRPAELGRRDQRRAHRWRAGIPGGRAQRIARHLQRSAWDSLSLQLVRAGRRLARGLHVLAVRGGVRAGGDGSAAWRVRPRSRPVRVGRLQQDRSVPAAHERAQPSALGLRRLHTRPQR